MTVAVDVYRTSAGRIENGPVFLDRLLKDSLVNFCLSLEIVSNFKDDLVVIFKPNQVFILLSIGFTGGQSLILH